MSISDKIADTITYLRESRNAIIARGGTIASNAGLKDLPLAISNIPIDSNISFYDDATVAYSKIVPVGAQPQAQLVSVGGMTRVGTGANLLTMGVKHLNLNATYPLVFSERLPAGTYRYFEKIEYDNTMDSPEYGNRAYEAVVGAFATNYDGGAYIDISTSEAFVLDKEYNVVLECGVISTGITPSVSIRYNYTGDYNDANSKDVAVTIGQATEDIICSRGETLYIWVNSNSYFYMSSSGGEIASQKLRPDTYSFTVSREFDESETAVNFTFREDTEFTIPITLYPMIYAVPDDSEKHIRKEYEPYKRILVPTPVSKIVSEGKNLYDANNIIAGSFNSDGSFLTMPHLVRTETLIPIVGGKAYTLSCDPTYGLRFVYFYDASKAYISNIWMNRPQSHFYTFTTPSEAAFVHISWELDGTASGNIDVEAAKNNSKLQLELGSVATEYKSYVGTLDTFAIPEAVRSIYGYGWGVNENFNSYITPSSGKFTRHTERVEFNGTENWVLYDASGKYRLCVGITETAHFVDNNTVSSCICNFYNAISNGQTYLARRGVSIAPAQIFIYDENYQEVTKWKAHLAELYANGNPLVIEYALATPIVTTIDDYSYKLPKLIRTEAGGTITFENEAKEAVPSSVKYLIKTT